MKPRAVLPSVLRLTAWTLRAEFCYSTTKGALFV